MPVITLPDGSQREFSAAVSIADVAADIGPGLAKAALAGQIDGKLLDTSHVIDSNAELSIITSKNDEGLEILRHSCAHLLAQAVKELFPEAQVTIGPVIDNGFYYDFAYERSFTPEDLTDIEAKMVEISARTLAVTREVWPRNKAIEYFKSIGEDYKAEIIADIPEGDDVSVYSQGDFKDLCRGPHVPNTQHIKAFKLTKIAGAYWRGDANNEMLQRIYGTAWSDKKSLKKYLTQLAEAEKRDHRRIGKQMDMFHVQEEAPGMIFWHPKGWQIYVALQDYIRDIFRANAYQEVHTPQVVDRTLWEKSGHWDKFGDMIFTTHSEHRDYAVKPMNCPCHVQIYNQGLKSYRDLPLRMAEFGSCHRNEPSGTLHGLMRVRNFVQDDGHIFCTEDQIQSEVSEFIKLVFSVYQELGFDSIEIALSTRPEKRVGEDELWDKAETALEQALDAAELNWRLQPGEGAFYGPKIEFALRDCLDRVWQCGTIQVDFSMPGRLGATYVDENSNKQTPVMLHRAILGSLERFIGILIEHYEGMLPLWLAPQHAVIMSITDRQADTVKNYVQKFAKKGLIVHPDLRNEKIGFKIREHTLERVPYLLIVGDKEQENSTVTVRARDGRDLGSFSIDEIVDRFEKEVASRGSQKLED